MTWNTNGLGREAVEVKDFLKILNGRREDRVVWTRFSESLALQERPLRHAQDLRRSMLKTMAKRDIDSSFKEFDDHEPDQGRLCLGACLSQGIPLRMEFSIATG